MSLFLDDLEIELVASAVTDAVIMHRLGDTGADGRRQIVNSAGLSDAWKLAWRNVYTEAVNALAEGNYVNYSYFDLCADALVYNTEVLESEHQPCLDLLALEWDHLDEWGVGEGVLEGWPELRDIRLKAFWLGVGLGYLT